MKKNIKKICKNCQLFDPSKNVCAIIILHEGERIKLPVEENDECFFQGQYFDPTTKSLEEFSSDVQQVRFWVEDKNGQKTNGNGTVKMEFPENFFGSGVSADQEITLD